MEIDRKLSRRSSVADVRLATDEALEAAQMVAWEWDSATDEFVHSASAHRVLGLPPTDGFLTNQDFLAMVHPDDRDRLRRSLERALDFDSDGEYREEFRFVKPDGSVIWLADSGRRLHDEADRPPRMAGILREVTDRKQAEQTLRESEERFRTLADNIAQFAWMADEDGAIFWYNRRWLEYTGTTLSEVEGWGWQKVHHPDHVTRVVESLRRAFHSGEPWEDTFPLRKYDGTYRWFLSRAIPIRDGAGRVVRWFGTNTDISERMRLERELRRRIDELAEIDRRKNEFLALLGHELRNPLAAIVNGVQVLENADERQGEASVVREAVLRQARHMTHLIDDLLDASRIGRGKVTLRREQLDLVPLLWQTAEDIRPIVEEGGCTLEVRLPETPIWIDGDATRLAQVTANLLHNAAKFTDSGGQITLAAERISGEPLAAITVRDTGIGMNHETLERLFVPYSQAERSMERSRGGLGLGLALVKGLVELHGGTVDARSDGLGYGSEFLIRLPLSSKGPSPSRATPPAAMEPGRAARRFHILVVEDTPAVAKLFAMMLGQLGHRVEVVSGGTDALEHLHKNPPEILFSDISMPGMSGYELAHQVRGNPEFDDIPLVAMTGFGQQEDRDRALEAGFDYHLVKPADFESLQRLFQQIASQDSRRITRKRPRPETQ